MHINLTHPRQILAAAALAAAAGAAIPAVGIALAPLPSSTTIAHGATLGCTKAAVCTTAATDRVIAPSAGSAALAAEYYPIARVNAVVNIAAKSAFVCYDACQRN